MVYLILYNRFCVEREDYEFNLLVPCLCIFFNNVILFLFLLPVCRGFVGCRVFGVNLATLLTLYGISVLYAKMVSLTFL